MNAFKRLKWYVYANIISVLFRDNIDDEVEIYIENNIDDITRDQAEAYYTGSQECYDY